MKQLTYVFIFVIIVFLIIAIKKTETKKKKGGSTLDNTTQNSPDYILDDILSKTNHGSWKFRNILNSEGIINKSIILCFRKDKNQFFDLENKYDNFFIKNIITKYF